MHINVIRIAHQAGGKKSVWFQGDFPAWPVKKEVTFNLDGPLPTSEGQGEHFDDLIQDLVTCPGIERQIKPCVLHLNGIRAFWDGLQSNQGVAEKLAEIIKKYIGTT